MITKNADYCMSHLEENKCQTACFPTSISSNFLITVVEDWCRNVFDTANVYKIILYVPFTSQKPTWA